MGIPGLFNFIRREHGDSFPRIDSSPKCRELRFEALYLDMNGIIHDCIDYRSLTSETIIFNAVAAHVDKIVDIIQPETIYFAVDGSSPHAKLYEQRVRRFRPATGTFFGAFDGNNVSPGTEFMAKMSSFLKYHIKERIQQSQMWRSAKVILSDSSVPGEGEHKIVEYIRQVRQDGLWRSNARHCIYGNDSDLILLALASHEPRISVLRYKPQLGGNEHGMPGWLDLVDVGHLRQSIARNILSNPTDRDASRICDDFVLLCHLAGNDFLPPLPGYSVVDGMDTLLREYKALVVKLWRGFITRNDGTEVVLGRLQQLLARLGELQRTQPVPPRTSTSVTTTAEHRKSYIEGILWCQQYYMRRCSSWTWHYPYNYAPYAEELQDFADVKVPSGEQTATLSPFEYLLALLPQTSSDLLPAPYAKLLRRGGPLAAMSSAPFESSTTYAAVPGASLIGGGSSTRPTVDMELVVAAYAKVSSAALTLEERDRDRLGRVVAFEFDLKHRETVPPPLRSLKELFVTVRCDYNVGPGKERPPPLPAQQARIIPPKPRHPPRSRMFYDGLSCVPGYGRSRYDSVAHYMDKYDLESSMHNVTIRM